VAGTNQLLNVTVSQLRRAAELKDQIERLNQAQGGSTLGAGGHGSGNVPTGKRTMSPATQTSNHAVAPKYPSGRAVR